MNPWEGRLAQVAGKEQEGVFQSARKGLQTQETNQPAAPIVDVSEQDGAFHVYADFSMMVTARGGSDLTVEFGRHGVILRGGGVQRDIPIPTDGEIERATVSNRAGIVRISIPTTGLGHRWRAIITQ